MTTYAIKVETTMRPTNPRYSTEGRMTKNGRGDIIDSCVIARTNGLIDVYSGYRLADEEEGLFA